MYEFVSRVIRRWSAIAAVLSLALGNVAANAAIFVANWDPIFNPAFSVQFGVDLGWSGSATVTVSDPCVTPSALVTFPNGCGTATFDGYTVIFYDTVPANVLAGSAGAGPGLPDPDVVSFDGSGVVNGIDQSGPIAFGPFTFGSGSFNASLDFTLFPFNGPILTLTEIGCEFDCDWVSATSGENAPVVTWSQVTQVPEPVSIALFGAGLTALGLARRRRV